MVLNASSSRNHCASSCPVATTKAGSATLPQSGAQSAPDSFRNKTNAQPRFGGGDSETLVQKPGFLKKTFATSLGVLSGIGLAIGVPLGLLQLAVGLVFHPLLITGLITMAIPAAGLFGAWLLGREKTVTKS